MLQTGQPASPSLPPPSGMLDSGEPESTALVSARASDGTVASTLASPHASPQTSELSIPHRTRAAAAVAQRAKLRIQCIPMHFNILRAAREGNTCPPGLAARRARK